MKRIISLFLVVSICFSPALAAGGGFSDVPAGSWYARAVETCVDAGLMSGTGSGKFSPEKPLTGIECLALAARLHEIQNGGDGVLPHAPEDWGKITLTTEDGTVISGYGDSDTWVWYVFTHYGEGYLYHPLGTPELDAWGETQHGKPATVTVDGVDYRGKVEKTMPFDRFTLVFYPEDEDTATPALHRAYLQRPAPDKWYRDAFYYVESQGLLERFPDTSLYGTEAATRLDFAHYLAAVGGLEPVNAITELPDTTDEAVLSLYNAGILNGLDDYGTFGGTLGLTRAEGAVMLARALEPETRLTFTPAPLPYLNYTLTELDTQGGTAAAYTAATGLLRLDFFEEEPAAGTGTTPMGILRADGSLLRLEEGVLLGGGTDETGLLSLNKIGPGGGIGVMDAASGEMVVPFGAYETFIVTQDGHILTCPDQNAPQPVWTLWDGSGTETATLTGDADWSNYNEGLAPRVDPETGLWGYADASGAWAIPARWDAAGPFRDGCAVVTDGDSGLRGAIDKSGNVRVPAAYENLFNQGGGLFIYTDWRTRDAGWVWVDGRTMRSAYTNSKVRYSGGYIALDHRYLNADGVPVTPVFDWVGPVAGDGSAFVGLDGRVYRLQFAG